MSRMGMATDPYFGVETELTWWLQTRLGNLQIPLHSSSISTFLVRQRKKCVINRTQKVTCHKCVKNYIQALVFLQLAKTQRKCPTTTDLQWPSHQNIPGKQRKFVAQVKSCVMLFFKCWGLPHCSKVWQSIPGPMWWSSVRGADPRRSSVGCCWDTHLQSKPLTWRAALSRQGMSQWSAQSSWSPWWSTQCTPRCALRSTGNGNRYKHS